MEQTIYADVLVIINIYINYGLLLLTCMLGKLPCERLRILLGALFGGLYSLIIIVPDISNTAISASRIPALAIMIYLAFGFSGVKSYVKKMLLFFAVNAVFAGAVFILWFFIYPEGMYYNSGVVYFDINALTLVLMTVGIYLLIRLISFFVGSRIPESCIYNVEIYISGRCFFCKGFYDSGNCLTDPFSGEGITIVHKDILEDYINFDGAADYEALNEGIILKLIPVKTLTGEGLLPALRADRIKIHGIENSFTLEKPIIALSEEKIHAGDYGVLLNASVFENAINGIGD